MTKFKTKGFTLIELLVVIAIIAILAILIIAALNAARVRARDSRRKSDLRSLQPTLELYNDKVGAYPTSGGYGDLDDDLSDEGLKVEPWPSDPGINAYEYGAEDAGADYALGAELENPTDNNNDGIDDNAPCGGSTGGANYCVGTDIDLNIAP